MAVVEEAVVPEVDIEVPLVLLLLVTATSSSDSKSLWKVSSLLFPRRIPFGFRLKGLENMDKDLDDSEEELELVVDEDSLASAKRRVWNSWIHIKMHPNNTKYVLCTMYVKDKIFKT